MPDPTSDRRYHPHLGGVLPTPSWATRGWRLRAGSIVWRRACGEGCPRDPSIFGRVRSCLGFLCHVDLLGPAGVF